MQTRNTAPAYADSAARRWGHGASDLRPHRSRDLPQRGVALGGLYPKLLLDIGSLFQKEVYFADPLMHSGRIPVTIDRLEQRDDADLIPAHLFLWALG